MENVTVIIPVNYTDAGKILGIFELRKLIETIVLCVPLLLFLLFILPFAINVNIIISAIFVVPIAGFSIMGVHDYSLINFLRVYFVWKRAKKSYNFQTNKAVQNVVD